MKTVRILGIILILALIVSAFRNFAPGFIDGWNDAEADLQLTLPTDFSSVSLSVKGYKDGAIPDSLFNRAMQSNVPCETNEISTYVVHSSWSHIVNILIFPMALLCLYGFYCLVRLLIAVSRGDILTRKNIRRLRFFIYPAVAFSALFELNRYILYRSALHELVPADYVFADFHLKYSWTFMLIIALLVEIFAQAVRIKEENDLTI